jgi:hypothetical protein
VLGMSGVTAIELGVDSCVVARVRVHRGTTQISGVYGLRREEALPDSDRGGHLSGVRREKGFPRHARVVAWGVPEGTSVSDPAARIALAPLLQAGFVIDAVLSPPEALTLLAKQRPRPAGRTGAAWLALNRHAAAIAIVHGSELLFSRVFNWNHRPAATLREELLQRYSLVAHLAPELRHGFDVIRAERGAAVDAIVTCGDLPDLRSLTMPLIEELDMEVETLDSLDGLQIVSPARAEEIAAKAPALRLATAAGVEGAALLRQEPSQAVLAAAAVAVVSAVLWGASQFIGNSGEPTGNTQPARPVGDAGRTSPPRPVEASPSPTTPSASDAGSPRAPERARGLGDPNVPAATTGQTPGGSVGGIETPSRTSDVQRPQAPPQPVPQDSLGRIPPREPRKAASTAPAASADRRQVPLNVPLPSVNSILVSPDRRLAVLDGVIVHEGEAFGPRVVVRIEPDAVVLREPSGYEVRVPMGRTLGAPPANGGGSDK